ncbi:hypothetical protein ABN028_26325 [Actinopolymorpha sp. B17G11]|uniref:SHOCT-like domain-containing protein n=1 Tax=unclassified Actinopolymorpha TaxID=2627063 RepID=UPI0032D919C3
MNDRKQILQMLAEGQITADEAEQLIAALERDRPVQRSTAVEPGAKRRPKFLRVLVENTPDHGNGPGRVNVRIPLQLLRAGVQLTTLIPPQALGQVNEEMHNSGMPIDLSRLKPEHIEDLIEQLDEVTVDVDQPDAKVRVFCE